MKERRRSADLAADVAIAIVCAIALLLALIPIGWLVGVLLDVWRDAVEPAALAVVIPPRRLRGVAIMLAIAVVAVAAIVGLALGLLWVLAEPIP